jgi:hypothetical protein
VHDSSRKVWLAVSSQSLFTNEYENLTPDDRTRIKGEFESSVVPNLIEFTQKYFNTLAQLQCQSDDKTKALAELRFLNHKLLLEQVTIHTQYHFGHEMDEIGSPVGDKVGSWVCDKGLDSFDVICLSAGFLAGGVAEGLTDITAGLGYAVKEAPNMISRDIRIRVAPELKQHLIP